MSLQEWLAECSGVHVETLSRIVNDLYKIMNIENKKRYKKEDFV